MAGQQEKERMTDRLSGRLDRAELRHESMPGGKGLYRGELATRALEAVGARAMTLDRSVIVSDDFDASQAQDRALFAHELYHAEHGDGGGGGAGDNFRDAEEVAARAVESLALHRETVGGYEAGHRPDEKGIGAHSDRHQSVVEQAQKATTPSTKSENADPDAAMGYKVLRDQGCSHEEVVIRLSRQVIQSIQDDYEFKSQRAGHLKGTI